MLNRVGGDACADTSYFFEDGAFDEGVAGFCYCVIADAEFAHDALVRPEHLAWGYVAGQDLVFEGGDEEVVDCF